MANVERVGIGGTMLTLLAGRYGMIPGRPGLALTRKIGTHSAKKAVVKPYVQRAIRDLGDGVEYTSNPVISKAQYDEIKVPYPTSERLDKIDIANALSDGNLSTLRQRHQLDSRVWDIALDRVPHGLFGP
jgi:hypothetical protein